ncbi:MAG: Peptidase Ste24p [Gammaproteobacteria bacterium]|nr:Peptidase Ste24p [Gammaproteobacteria bacterium]
MDFYSRQAAARGQTRWLIFAFIVALLAVALALDFVLFTFLAGRSVGYGLSALDYARANPQQVVLCTLLVMGVLGLASLYKSMELRGGGGVVARSLGGVPVSSDTADLKRKRLLNVVEEMAIASGVPMPEVYVLEQEPGINAFAAGHTPANAAVTVTQGALDRLSRDELQGVIGHEFSHVLNGDMRLNVQLMGWIFGLFVIGLIGRMILEVSPRNRRNSGGLVALGFAVMVLGYIGLMAGRILQAAVARQRERLADASGVQFTRNPQGLKGALVKIAALPEGSALVAADAEQAAHMFFAEGLSRVFATHPPILERIRELDPHFDPRELEAAAAEPDQDPTAAEVAGHGGGPVPSAARGQVAGGGLGGVGQIAGANVVPGAGLAAATAAATGPATSNSPASHFANQVGRPDVAHIAHAQAVRLALPQPVRELTESPGGAQALVIALLISSDPAVRDQQLAMLSKSANAASLAVIQRVIPLAQALDPMLRLPALQRAFPALRRSTVPQRKALGQLATQLIHADARIDVFEFCLAKLLETLLNDELDATAPHGTVTLEGAVNEISLLFSVLAQIGTQDERAARESYEVGISTVLPMRRPPYAAVADWAQKLSAALPRLEQLHPFAKKAVIEGLVKTIANDEVLMEEEAELLRTVCALLHCPLPPLLPVIAGDASVES